MTSHVTAAFREQFRALPEDVQRQARAAYQRFRGNPSHPGLRFKKVHSTEPIYSVRVNRDYRSVGVLSGEEIVWFWIGSHAEYERLLANL